MAVEHIHIGISALDRKEGITYNEDTKSRVGSVDGYDLKIEYLKFEEGTPLPEILSKQPHVTYKVDDLNHHASQAQRIIFGPADCGPSVRLAFVIWDDTTVELYEEK